MADENQARTPGPEALENTGKAVIRRWIHNDRALIVSSGDFNDLYAAWMHHASLWEGLPDGLSSVLMRQALGVATLHLVNRPRDESVAWTLNLQKPPTNLFLTGDTRAGTITGRVFVDFVRTADSSRLFVQTQRPRRQPTLSAIEVDGFDALDIFEQYYRRSEQNPARFYELDLYRFLMVLGMPGVDRAWLEILDREAAEQLPLESRLLEERLFRFECGCSPRKMLSALRSIFEKDPLELFQGEDRVETSCPRCGRRWWITRDQFDEGAGS